jgi:diaminohydroxyphosphoribosylaminopyrimidine deaminase/5-amino-6-(5-phosphoribosylamino)uracil reductase
MQRALELAERGRGYVEPNPLVGAVLVKNGKIVGEGWHEKYGQAHAEVNAIDKAREAARGATLYVTLEPCCHHGKTPPCTDAIIESGIAHVVAATADPFPQVAGQGAKALQAAGIPISFGIGEEEARHQNVPYFKLLSAGRPYVHAKWAMTLDGKIATRTGDSKWISNEASRRKVHELRGRMDGIVAGIGTALADDPMLTARPPGPRVATRVILDSRARLPLTAKLVTTAQQTPTLVVVADGADPKRLRTLESSGCQTLSLPRDAGGRPALTDLLTHLGKLRWTNLLVEGGAEVLGAFFDARAIDEVHVFVAPTLVGGSEARTALGGAGVQHVAEALSLARVATETVDGDLYIHGWL